MVVRKAKARAWEWLSQQQTLVAWSTWISACSSLNRLVQQWLLNSMKQEVTIEDFSPGSCHPQWREGKCIKTILRHLQKRTNIYCTRCSDSISFILFSPYNESWEFSFCRSENWSSEGISGLLQASQLLSTINRIWAQGSQTPSPVVYSLHHAEVSRVIQNLASVLSTTIITKETLTRAQMTRRHFPG